MQVVNTSFVCVQNTIHKAKRDRLYNVIICLSDGIVLDFFLTSRYIKNKSHRVYNVGASRAKERLFFSIPSLSNENRK